MLIALLFLGLLAQPRTTLSVQLNQAIEQSQRLSRQAQDVTVQLDTVNAEMEHALEQQHDFEAQAEKLRQELVPAQLDLAALRLRFTEAYPGVIRGQRRVDELDAKYRQFLTTRPVNGHTITALTDRAHALRTQGLQLEQEMDQNRRDLERIQHELERKPSHTHLRKE